MIFLNLQNPELLWTLSSDRVDILNSQIYSFLLTKFYETRKFNKFRDKNHSRNWLSEEIRIVLKLQGQKEANKIEWRLLS